jgi:hypothetical protein
MYHNACLLVLRCACRRRALPGSTLSFTFWLLWGSIKIASCGGQNELTTITERVSSHFVLTTQRILTNLCRG